ncbi:MAG: hypothetical protein ABSD48_16095 [Armatimonadota bacterium]
METSWLGVFGRRAARWIRAAALQFRQRPWLAVVLILLLVPGAVVVLGGILVLAVFLTKVIWAWTIPDLFPRGVEQGLIAATISWFTAFKIVIALAFFGALAHAGAGRGSDQRHG